MKRERGLVGLPQLLVGLAILAAIAAIVYGVTAYLDDVDAKGYTRGQKETAAAYEKRDSEKLAKATARVKELEDQVRAQERQHAVQLAGISAQYQEDLANVEKAKRDFVAGVHSGRIRLLDPGAAAGPRCPGGSGGAPGETAAAAGGRDGPAPGELSREAAEFLLGLASEADALVKQLTACQRVVVQDRSAAPAR